MFTWGELGLIQICGKNAASLDAIVAACKAIAGHPGVVRLAGLRDQHGRDRALHPGDRGPSVRDLGPGRGRRSRRGALHRRRAPARHRQRAQPRHLLQDARPERADDPPAHGGPGALVLRGRGFGGATGRDQTGRHPGHGGLGVLARDGRQLPGARHGHLVEAGHDGGRHRRHHRRASASACSTSSSAATSRASASSTSG